MRHFTLARKFLLFSLLCGTMTVNAQIHPLAFGSYTLGTFATDPNWYASYVGLQFEVTSPSVIAGPKVYVQAPYGAMTGAWAAAATTPLHNVPIYMDNTLDSFGYTAYSSAVYAGKIAVIWRGPEFPIGTITSPAPFQCKAENAQAAGALAVVLINEYSDAGPIGMASDPTLCPGTVTIPVFMIGNSDGIAISAQYRAGVPVTMSITPWGYGLPHDVGFVPDGIALWHTTVLPSDQLPAGGTLPAPYKGLNGAFIANYGLDTAQNVNLKVKLNYTPTGGATIALDSETIGGETSFPPIDSIYANFSSSEYSFAPPSTGTGRYDLNYTIVSSVPNDNAADTALTYSFYTSDSVYSKGRYDFVNNVPIVQGQAAPGGGTDFVWGNMYYVAHGHDAISSMQFTLYNPVSTFGSIVSAPMSVYVFKWNDGSNGEPLDSVIQSGEFDLVAQNSIAFGTLDTSGVIFKVFLGDSVGTTGIPIYLDTNAWYYVCVDVTGGLALGMDGGFYDAYPRIYGRFNATGYLENNNCLWNGDYNVGTNLMISTPSGAFAPVAFPETNYINSIDSFNYAGQKSLVPSISLIVTGNPDTSNLHTGVNQVVKPFADVKLFPNPASEYIDVSVNLSQAAPVATYAILDGLARFVTKQVHYNVRADNFRISTADLASGTYFFTVNANGKVLTKKFTIIK